MVLKIIGFPDESARILGFPRRLKLGDTVLVEDAIGDACLKASPRNFALAEQQTLHSFESSLAEDPRDNRLQKRVSPGKDKMLRMNSKVKTKEA